MRQLNRQDLETTISRYAWNRLMKQSRENAGDICCGYCPYNKWENARGRGRYSKSWKRHRRHQCREY